MLIHSCRRRPLKMLFGIVKVALLKRAVMYAESLIGMLHLRGVEMDSLDEFQVCFGSRL